MIDQEAIPLRHDKDIVSKDYCGKHVDAVMRSKSYHTECLAEHCEQAEVSVKRSAARKVLVQLKDTGSNMSRIEKVCGGAIWNKEAHEPWISPVVTLRDFENYKIGCE